MAILLAFELGAARHAPALTFFPAHEHPPRPKLLRRWRFGSNHPPSRGGYGPVARLHPDRTARGDRDHRHTGGHAAAGPVARQVTGATGQLLEQSQTNGGGGEDVL